MKVGICWIKARIHGSRSLKGKRRVVRSLCDRVHRRFGVSIAEVAGQESWKSVVFGIASVSGESIVARKQVEKVLDYVEKAAYEIQILESDVDVVDFT